MLGLVLVVMVVVVVAVVDITTTANNFYYHHHFFGTSTALNSQLCAIRGRILLLAPIEFAAPSLSVGGIV